MKGQVEEQPCCGEEGANVCKPRTEEIAPVMLSYAHIAAN